MHAPFRAMPVQRAARFRLPAVAAICAALCLPPGLTACSAADGKDMRRPPAMDAPSASATIHDAASPGHAKETGRLLVKFHPTVPEEERAALRCELGASLARVIGFIGVEVWELPAAADPAQALERLNASPLVDYAEPDAIRRPRPGAPGGVNPEARP